jgi:hypothetical protein
MIFCVILLSTKAFALDNVGKNIISPVIAEGFLDIGKFVGTVIGGILALIGMLLWLVTRFLVFIFQLIGGIVYGFFINNPLDTEIGYIRPLWSFLVDFGNLVVIGSFIALALSYLFDLKLSKSDTLSQFAGGIVMIALLLNFSLTLTSAFASTVHSIGIGTVYATQSNIGTNLDLSSRNAFNKSVAKTGNSFFTAVTNNFVENVSCFGNKTTEYKTGAEGKSETKSMASVCQFHKKDNGEQLNGLTIIAASDGTPEAFTFYMILIIRELMVLILLSVGIFVLIKLLKVAVFRLAYLWLVGIFAGPALVAAFSPFDGMKKYFQTWLKWLVVFSTMMIVFVAGFYLSSYIATINIPSTAVSYEPLINPLESPGLFVSQLVNSIIEIVVPNVMFPIIGLVILFLLGKYLDDTYKDHAEKAMKAGGKLLNDARTNVGNAIRMPGRIATGAIGATAGGLKNISNTGAAIGSIKNSTLSKINARRAFDQRNAGRDEDAKVSEARAVKYAGKNAVNKQIMANRNEAVTNFMSGKDFKAKLAEIDYLGRKDKEEVMKRLGGTAPDTKGISQEIINKGNAISNFNRTNTAGRGMSRAAQNKKIENDIARSNNTKFEDEFNVTQSQLRASADNQKNNAYKMQQNADKDSLSAFNREKQALEDFSNKEQNGILKKGSATYNAKAVEDYKRKVLTNQNSYDRNIKESKVKYDNVVLELDKMIEKIDVDISKNEVVANAVNERYIAANPKVKEKAAFAIRNNDKTTNTTRSIYSKVEEATNLQKNVNGMADVLVQQLKDIDDDENVNNTYENKQRRKKQLLETVSSNEEHIKKLAERKYAVSKSKDYIEEE